MAVLKMGVAVNDRRKNPQSGEWEDVPNFVDVIVFGTRGESLSRFLSKGSKVADRGQASLELSGRHRTPARSAPRSKSSPMTSSS